MLGDTFPVGDALPYLIFDDMPLSEVKDIREEILEYQVPFPPLPPSPLLSSLSGPLCHSIASFSIAGLEEIHPIDMSTSPQASDGVSDLLIFPCPKSRSCPAPSDFQSWPGTEAGMLS